MNRSKPRILLIDDTPANLFTLGSALAGEFDLQIADSGAKGLALAAQAPPDLIVLDIMMPEMDGFETCRRLKAQPALRQIPVVFVTALDDLESEVQGLALGAADYITKPINVQVARQRIFNLLERERLRHEVEVQRDRLQTEVLQRMQSEEMQRKLSIAVEQGPASVVITDLAGNIEYVNSQFTQVTGYSADEVLGRNPRMLQSKLTPRQTHVDLWDRLLSGLGWKCEFINRRKSGDIYWEEVQIAPVKNPDGVVTHYVSVQTDISARKRLEEQVHMLAFHDPLTQLPNRRLLNDRLGQMLVEGKRRARSGALMFLDLDNFKPLNDTHGHDIGDLLLIEVAARLKACVREIDTVARSGGDEFVVALNDLDLEPERSTEQARAVAEKICAALSAPYLLTLQREGLPDISVQHQCSASIGVAVFRGNEATQNDLIKWADTAMYQAKLDGGRSIRFYSADA